MKAFQKGLLNKIILLAVNIFLVNAYYVAVKPFPKKNSHIVQVIVEILTGAVPTFARVKLSYKYRLAQNVPSNKKGFQWPKISS